METDPLDPDGSTGLDRSPLNETITNTNDHPTPDPLDFICFVCHNEFDDMAKLYVHMSMKHKGIRPYRCEYCSKVFAFKKSVSVHLQLHHFGRDNKYLCLHCKSYFHRANDLIDHNAIVHNKAFRCTTCCKCFTQMNELTMHERLHSFNRPFRCRHCDEVFMSQSSRSVHVSRVHSYSVVRLVSCPLCDYSFAKESELSAHLFVHNDDGVDPFECPDCAELFDTLELFVEHMGLHERKGDGAMKVITIDEESFEPVNIADDSNDFMDASAVDDDMFNDRIDDNDTNLSKMVVANDDADADIAELHTGQSIPNTQSIIKPTIDGMLKPNRPKTVRKPVSLKWQQNDNKVRNFSCDKCDRSFTMASTLSLHLRRTHLGIKPYKCQVCEWAFAQSSDLIKHMRKHTGEKPYSCSTCGARFSQNRNLRNHMKMHTDEPSVCKYCEKKFLIDTSLVQHLKKHEGPNIIHCSVCNVPFSAQSFLDKHAKRCLKKEKYQCAQCDKAFHKASDLVKHNRKHTGERPFVCPLCNKTFSHPTSLRNHSAVHTKLRPFICSFCGAAFSFHGNLKVHLLSHSGERPFTCQSCGKMFARSANLKEHNKIHTGEKNYKCEICEKKFTNSSTFSKHKKIHSGEKPHHCSVCDRSFSQHAHLVKHTRIHTNEKPYGCEVCNKYFRRSDTLANHLRTHLKDDRNNYNQKVSIALTTDASEHQLTELQVPDVAAHTHDLQLIQQTITNEMVEEDVPQIFYTITTPANVTGVSGDQMNVELMNDAQTNPHFIITSL